MRILLFAYFFAAAVLIGSSIPLIRGRIPPNPLYGLRTPSTLRHPEIWYPANTYAAWRLLWTGVVLMVATIGLYLTPGIAVSTYALILVGLLLGGVFVTLVQSLLFIRQLRRHSG
jgi:hypothetical protein